MPAPGSETYPSPFPTFDHDGAQIFRSAIGPAELEAIEKAVEDLPADRAGIRLYGITQLCALLQASGVIGRIAASALGSNCRPVRAILFDKTAATNWGLQWHQDRTIVVKEKIEVEGFGPWTVKQGLLHVEPPFELLAGMATLRIHLDPVPETNAPLLVAPGSHKLGRIPVNEVPDVVERHGVYVCTASRGDIWLYATPILHASEASLDPFHRRVLQVDYATADLPSGLEWLGV